MLVLSGELTPVARLIQEQQNGDRPVLLGLAYTNPDRYLKLQSVVERQPSLVVLGTSRSMQFRAAFFADPGEFYNAGGGVETIRDFSGFLSRIPEGLEPAIMIIGLDQYFFNDKFDMQERPFDKPQQGAVWQSGVKGLAPDYMKGKFRLSDIFARQGQVKKIGLNALMNNNGFLNDGSYYYGSIMEDPTSSLDYQFQDTFKRIEAGNRRFQYGKEISKEALEELEKFLKLAKERNVYVIGFLPPYAHEVYERMMAMEDKYTYILKLEGSLGPIFDAHGFGLYDFSDLATLGATDKETIDGFHGSEKAYVRLLLLMAEDNGMLGQRVDSKYLGERLNSSANDYSVFEVTE